MYGPKLENGEDSEKVKEVNCKFDIENTCLKSKMLERACTCLQGYYRKKVTIEKVNGKRLRD